MNGRGSSSQKSIVATEPRWWEAEREAVSDLGRAVKALLDLGWSMNRVVSWVRAVKPDA